MGMTQNQHFNTSHVSINRSCKPPAQSVLSLISIHLMFLLIDLYAGLAIANRNFNTSHVSINLLGSFTGYFIK